MLIEIELRCFTDIHCPFFVETFDEFLDQLVQLSELVFDSLCFRCLCHTKQRQRETMFVARRQQQPIGPYSCSNARNCSIGCV